MPVAVPTWRKVELMPEATILRREAAAGVSAALLHFADASHRAGLRLSLPDPGSGFEPGEYEVVQGARPSFPIGCGVDLPQARQGEDNVVWIKSGAYDARLLGGG
jgi:hypothetical protein